VSFFDLYFEYRLNSKKVEMNNLDPKECFEKKSKIAVSLFRPVDKPGIVSLFLSIDKTDNALIFLLVDKTDNA